jgi:tryptophan 7-halogenase
MINANASTFKYTVVGGGTAGWLSALYLRKYFPQASITLIESKEIGILGAGEGSTPQIIDMFNELDVPITGLIKNTKATIKNGIKFTNWNGDGKHYYHNFARTPMFDINCATIIGSSVSTVAVECIGEGKDLSEVELTAILNQQNKTSFYLKNGTIKDIEPMANFDNIGYYALHFNAVSLADYLKSIGIARNIKVIEGKVTNIKCKDSGDISCLDLDNGTTVDCDFVFDCTGFARLIIGKHYNSEWSSYKNNLPVNRAIPFTMNVDPNNIPPYTEAIAMKYGWAWKIPVQDRYGCGYVFDSRLVSDEEAKQEVYNLCGKVTDVPRVFSFEPGAYKKTWINNCVAIGLAAGFIEPLEATSIWSQIVGLRAFATYIRGLTHRDQNSINYYNTYNSNIAEGILKFIHFHYFTTKRTDTTFWADFAKNNTTPSLLKDIISKDVAQLREEIQTKNPNYGFFTVGSYLQVGAGKKYFDQKQAKELFESLTCGYREELYRNVKKEYISNINSVAKRVLNHRAVLSLINQ